MGYLEFFRALCSLYEFTPQESSGFFFAYKLHEERLSQDSLPALLNIDYGKMPTAPMVLEQARGLGLWISTEDLGDLIDDCSAK